MFVCLFVYADGKEKQIKAATLTNECPVVGIWLTSKNSFNVLQPSDVVEGIWGGKRQGKKHKAQTSLP